MSWSPITTPFLSNITHARVCILLILAAVSFGKFNFFNKKYDNVDGKTYLGNITIILDSNKSSDKFEPVRFVIWCTI